MHGIVRARGVLRRDPKPRRLVFGCFQGVYTLAATPLNEFLTTNVPDLIREGDEWLHGLTWGVVTDLGYIRYYQPKENWYEEEDERS